jgi:hypothetical protein
VIVFAFMARGSANLKLVANGERFASGSADKKVVEWKEMERRVAERIAKKAHEKAARGEAQEIPPWKLQALQESQAVLKGDRPPDSGIRASQPDEAATELQVPTVGTPGARGLSFTVYSVEDLDARQRVTAPPPAPEEIPSKWPDVWASFKVVATTALGVLRTPKTQPRPKLMDAIRIPIAQFRGDLLIALKELPWKKIAVRGGIAVGCIVFALALVVTAADLTDDLKPTHATNASAAQIDGKSVDAKPAKAATPAPVEQAEPAPAIELDDGPASPTAKHSLGKKPGAKKKKKGAEPFAP